VSALAGAPPLDFSPNKAIIDITASDPVSEQVGRPGHLVDLTVDACLIPSDRGGTEPAVFDRCYYRGDDGEEQVLVDTLSGGSEYEVSQQEAEKHVALKREWCEAQGIRYLVHIDGLLAAFS